MDKQYAAGFFDGAGYIGLGVGYRIEIRIVNTNYKVLELLQKHWGGGIYKRKQISGRKQTYDWVIVAKDDTQKFLNDIYPFLVVKKQQIDRTAKLYYELHK